MEELHKLLKRQLKKHLSLSEVPVNLEPFINSINEAYKQYDDDKLMVERSLELSSKELSEVIERLQETQMELIQREKMAGIGQLAAGIAHEINNPLGYIISNLSTLNKYVDKYLKLITIYKDIIRLPRDMKLEEYTEIIDKMYTFEKQSKIDYINSDVKELIEETTEGLNRIVKIVKGLRDFSRVDFKEDFTDYNLNQGIESTLLIANNSIKYNAEVKLEFSTLPDIQVLGGEINQVILNLLINAAHAVRDSGKKGFIRVATYKNGDNVVLEIEDSGTGILPENLIKIFDPFFTTKKIGEGTGLGLSIAYDIIVNKHKGEIEVKSEFGKGTTFIINIPINQML